MTRYQVAYSRMALAAIALAVVACGASTEPKTGGAPDELKALPRALTAAEQRVSSSGNDFAFALFQKVNAAQRDSNVFISPVSASMALGMTMNGAANRTYDQMRAALQFGDASQQQINDGYKGLIALLGSLDASTTFGLANSIWYDQTYPFTQSFLDVGRSYFDAEIRPMDFASPSTPTTINNWVSDKTQGKIPTIVDRIDPGLVMLLINAIYFKGSWRSRFDPAQTRDAEFHAAGGLMQTGKFMHHPAGTAIKVIASEDYDMAELPYGNGAWAMTIVLPHPDKDVETVAASLDRNRWDLLTTHLQESGNTELFLPKFKLGYERLLNDDLKALGMTDAFGTADFSRMSSRNDLYIEFVKQKTFVDVNEEGTEAAAVTAVGIAVTSAGPPPAVFRVDRPFIFAIRERLTGTILFMGKIVRLPTA